MDKAVGAAQRHKSCPINYNSDRKWALNRRKQGFPGLMVGSEHHHCDVRDMLIRGAYIQLV